MYVYTYIYIYIYIYIYKHTQCVACAAGKYKQASGNEACANCKAFSEASPGSISEANCLCKPGHGADALGTCVVCAKGFYKPNLANVACEQCWNGRTTLLPGAINGSTPWVPLIWNQCVAAPSYGFDWGQIQGCSESTFKSHDGNDACTTCPSSTTSEWAATECTVACPANFLSTLDGSACVCNAGFEASAGSQCTACASGKYTAVAGVACANPPANALAPNALSFLCNAGFSEPVVANACSACAAGTYKEAAGNDMELCVTCKQFSESASAIHIYVFLYVLLCTSPYVLLCEQGYAPHFTFAY